MKVVMRNYEYENTTAALQLPMYLIYLPISVFSAVIILPAVYSRISGDAATVCVVS
jgi:TRAP-type C4-dicarboxylate transport system permease small subunit